MISHHHRCIFTHIPKTAGKSILAAFGLPMLAKDYDGRITYIEQPYGHHPLAACVGLPEFVYFKFAFVRNPWDRLLSAFSYLDAGGCNRFDAAFRETHLARYRGSFCAFVMDIDRHLDGQHFRPQCDWVCDSQGRVLADFIGRYERIAEDFALIANRLSLDRDLPLVNTSQHGPYREHYDPPSRKVVERVYRDDIETFGYEY